MELEEIQRPVQDAEATEPSSPLEAYATEVEKAVGLVEASIQRLDRGKSILEHKVFSFEMDNSKKGSFIGQVTLNRVLENYNLFEIYVDPLHPEHGGYETDDSWGVLLQRLDGKGSFRVVYTINPDSGDTTSLWCVPRSAPPSPTAP